MADRKSTRGAVAALSERFAGLSAVPEPATPQQPPAAPATTPAKRERKPRGTRKPAAGRPRAMPAEQPRPPAWDRRIQLTVDAEMERALKEARIADGIQATARIRAMIGLWLEDEKLREKINKLAASARYAAAQPRQ